jgi:hypothetical protein
VRQIDLRLAYSGQRWGGIKVFFSILWRGAQMSNVDHSALL